jgi:single-strand DNA-binding protein
MGSVNLHLIVGTVGKDPVIRKTKDGKSICDISVATNDGDKGMDGKLLTNWHKVVCFDKVADFVGKYVGKGTLVSVQGPVKLRNFTGKDGKVVYIKETKGYKVEALSKSTRNNDPATYTPSGATPMTADKMSSIGDSINLDGGQIAGQEHTEGGPPHTEEDLPF